MRKSIIIPAAFALAVLPSASLAVPGQGAEHGVGWDHFNGPDATGQPGVECGEEDALLRPGNAENAPGSAFNEDGKAGTVYAGEQPQNSRNSASVSQYDTACLHVPR